MTRHLYIYILLFLVSGCIREEQFDNSPKGNFEALWKIMDEGYCFFEYKNIDWDAVFADYESFLEMLSKGGINVCRERGIEGDDWCAWWSDVLNNEGTNVIIWSKDKDLTQLVKTDNDGCFTVIWH